MIDFHTAPTPNGRKVSILLEELALPYQVHTVNLSKGEQKAPGFLALNANGKIPVIVDSEGPVVLAESGAILIYLAEKTGSALLPATGAARAQVFQWLMFQISGLGATFGRVFYFRSRLPEPQPVGLAHFETEAQRLLDVMETQLAAHPWLGGDTYSIADIATYPWMAPHEKLGIPLGERPAVRRWMDTMAQRPAVIAGMAVPG
ncbi:glutathione S-transferase family protein [Pararhodospirillum oryzae]|uniref:Thiol:disulfide oxidoreductase n=1 Tax=Pararhodospirillum oryzae TaxID=478448 RepID=A0A512H4R7_9PROT|nr:glutathione binding-like protein [Pararhodospirillum oryzae]GEO80370.1 thiol:disulfide oxidoreductase [Pararhodospirillum oryzae]